MSRYTISLIAQNWTPRKKYVADFVFEQILGIGYVHYEQHSPDNDYTYPIYYGISPVTTSAICIPSAGLLDENGIDVKWVNAFLEGDGDFVMTGDIRTNYTIEADIFSLIFFCLTRYEEYLPFNGDELGRFTARESVLHQTGKINIPLVDKAINDLKIAIERVFEIRLPVPLSCYRFYPTVDVDQAFAFYNKGWLNYAGMLSDFFSFRFKKLRSRVLASINQQKDPFNVYARMSFFHKKYAHEQVYFFFLVASRRSKLDKNHSPQDPDFRQVIQTVGQDAKIGLHPSYRSFFDYRLIEEEKSTLELVTNMNVTSTRQHYLLMKFPDTYRYLLASGLTHDYSMGFFDAIGYRASTGHSFYWYDLEKECCTELTVSPFQIMDVTLKKYLQHTPQTAKEAIEQIICTAKQYNSPLRSIWHNSSFAEALGWTDDWWGVYEYLLMHAGKNS